MRSWCDQVCGCRTSLLILLKADNLEDSPVKHFRYGDMPEVVTLPVGEYVARAYYGGRLWQRGGRPLSRAPLSWRVWPLHNQRE